MSDSFFSVKYVLGPRHMTACVYQQEPRPARRQAAVSTADAPARERTVRMQDEHEEPERDGTYTTVQPKAKRKAIGLEQSGLQHVALIEWDKECVKSLRRKVSYLTLP